MAIAVELARDEQNDLEYGRMRIPPKIDFSEPITEESIRHYSLRQMHPVTKKDLPAFLVATFALSRNIIPSQVAIMEHARNLGVFDYKKTIPDMLTHGGFDALPEDGQQIVINAYTRVQAHNNLGLNRDEIREAFNSELEKLFDPKKNRLPDELSEEQLEYMSTDEVIKGITNFTSSALVDWKNKEQAAIRRAQEITPSHGHTSVRQFAVVFNNRTPTQRKSYEVPFHMQQKGKLSKVKRKVA